MRTPEHPTLIRRMRDARLKRLAGTRPLVSASLVEVEVRCGSKGCHCATGRGHPSFYLTFKRKKKTVTVYVPKDRVTEVRGWVLEHKRVKLLLREISELGLALLKAEARVKRERKRRRRS